MALSNDDISVAYVLALDSVGAWYLNARVKMEMCDVLGCDPRELEMACRALSESEFEAIFN